MNDTLAASTIEICRKFAITFDIRLINLPQNVHTNFIELLTVTKSVRYSFTAWAQHMETQQNLDDALLCIKKHDLLLKRLRRDLVTFESHIYSFSFSVLMA